MYPDYRQLKERQRAIREDFPESLGLRVHRALSWLQRAENEATDDDARFIFLWIAFNAAYANEIPDRMRYGERSIFANFIGRLVEFDIDRNLYEIVWREFPGPIRLLIDNRYVFQPFWDSQTGRMEPGHWEAAFARSKATAKRAISKMDTSRVLGILFDRLYTLRNQLIHGGATWNSSVNRNQVADAANIMSKLVPVVISIMMDHPDSLWGDPCYPVIDI